jgi:hypothetical protein
MKNILFQTLVYQYPVLDWENKKSKILKYIKDENFIDNEFFLTDRKLSSNSYLDKFAEIFKDELEIFRLDINSPSMFLTDVWSAKYEIGDFHPIHNHSSSGYSGVLYVHHNEEEHSGTYFVNPQTNPITDLTEYSSPTVHEGAIIMVPSSILHFTYPNKSNLIRQIIGFDLKFKEVK